MKRKLPSHIIKYYEALACVAGGRILLLWSQDDGILRAQVYSSDRTKRYDVSYMPTTAEIMSNDNNSYRNDELWYPSIAFLLFLDVIDYQDRYWSPFAEFSWKRINTAHDNDWDKTQYIVEQQLQTQWVKLWDLYEYCDMLRDRLIELDLSHLGNKLYPAKSIIM